MVKQSAVLTVTLTFFSAVSLRAPEAQEVVSLTAGSGKYTLSVTAHEVPLEQILQELGEKCAIRVVTYQKALLSRPVNVIFKDAPPEQAIKKVLKAAGINNHLMHYRDKGKQRSELSVLVIFGNSCTSGERPLLQAGLRGGSGRGWRAHVPGKGQPEDTFAEKVEVFKEQYQWEDAETWQLAGYLLTVMPDPAKKQGLEPLIRALDSRMQEGNGERVNETLLHQAIGDTVPPHLKPSMMKSINTHIEHYRRGWKMDTFEGSPYRQYRDFMSRNQSDVSD